MCVCPTPVTPLRLEYGCLEGDPIFRCKAARGSRVQCSAVAVERSDQAWTGAHRAHKPDNLSSLVQYSLEISD